MTKAYEQSKNCKTEFNYAYEQNKERMVLKLKRFTSGTVLGSIVANQLYFRMTDDGTFKENIPKFLRIYFKKSWENYGTKQRIRKEKII